MGKAAVEESERVNGDRREEEGFEDGKGGKRRGERLP